MTLTQNDLKQFTGTEHYYKHWFGGYVYTDGVKYTEEVGKCSWLINAIFSYRRTEPFQIWTLDKIGSKAVLTMKEDSNTPELVRQEIGYTDFPIDSIKLYLIDKVLLLPSEY